MNDANPPFLERFNEIVAATQELLFIARASELQEDLKNDLNGFMAEIIDEKAGAVNSKNEDHANLLLGCQCVTHGIISELELLILLKQDDAELAWDKLIEAQMAYRSAVQAHDSFEYMSHHSHRLEVLEKTLFPPQSFMSVGAVIEKQECSICSNDYEKCDHIRGKPYMGEFCSIIITEAKLDHVSLVDKPADKRARVTTFSYGDTTRNQMTWRLETPGE